jgi:xanthine dehydrogenase accessory factor
MKEIQSIIKAYHQIDFEQHKASLATVVRVEGSSYRRTGARMLVLDNGTYLGGISGGCLEGDALRRAQKAIANDRASVVTYDTTKEDGHQIGVGLGCNGIIDVLFSPLKKIQNIDNQVTVLEKIVHTRSLRILVTITESDDFLGQTFLYENDEQFLSFFPIKKIAHSVLSDLKETLQKKQSVAKKYDENSVFIELITPTPNIILYGGNYDIHPLVQAIKALGWNATVVMNSAKADKSLYALGAKIIHHKSEIQVQIDPYSAVVLMSHDYKTDFENFQKILTSPTPYIGLLGPKKRGQKMFDALIELKTPIKEADFTRIFSPAGLDIGAQTPEEIALAILAEIKMVFAKRNGQSLKYREGTIYGEMSI